MPRYLAGRNRADGTVEIAGYVDEENAVDATFLARERYGDVGVMTPKAVERWMRRGAAVNEARNLVASER